MTNIDKLYNDLLGFIGNSGLGKVFLWGYDRTDIQMDIVQVPEETKWKKYSKTYTPLTCAPTTITTASASSAGTGGVRR